jgi:hypothetical protein
MNTLATIVAAFILATVAFSGALAQVPGLPDPALQNRIPAPLPPACAATHHQRSIGAESGSGVYTPRRLNTFSDRATSCLHEGSSYGPWPEARRLHARLRQPVVSRQ